MPQNLFHGSLLLLRTILHTEASNFTVSLFEMYISTTSVLATVSLQPWVGDGKMKRREGKTDVAIPSCVPLKLIPIILGPHE